MANLISHTDMLNGKLDISYGYVEWQTCTGNYSFPIQFNQGVVLERDNMTIKHEEADKLIIHQITYVGTPL